MCYLVAKRFNSIGSLALQTSHGQHLIDLKRRILAEVDAENIQLPLKLNYCSLRSQ